MRVFFKVFRVVVFVIVFNTGGVYAQTETAFVPETIAISSRSFEGLHRFLSNPDFDESVVFGNLYALMVNFASISDGSLPPGLVQVLAERGYSRARMLFERNNLFSVGGDRLAQDLGLSVESFVGGIVPRTEESFLFSVGFLTTYSVVALLRTSTPSSTLKQFIQSNRLPVLESTLNHLSFSENERVDVKIIPDSKLVKLRFLDQIRLLSLRGVAEIIATIVKSANFNRDKSRFFYYTEMTFWQKSFMNFYSKKIETIPLTTGEEIKQIKSEIPSEDERFMAELFWGAEATFQYELLEQSLRVANKRKAPEREEHTKFLRSLTETVHTSNPANALGNRNR